MSGQTSSRIFEFRPESSQVPGCWQRRHSDNGDLHERKREDIDKPWESWKFIRRLQPFERAADLRRYEVQMWWEQEEE